MKYALAAAFLFASLCLTYAEDAAEEDPKAQNELTKEQSADAKKAKERFMQSLKEEIALRQNRLSRSRAAVNSEERKGLKADVAEKKDEFAAALRQPMSHWLKQSEIDKEIDRVEAEKAVEISRRAREQEAINRRMDAERAEKSGPIKPVAIGLFPNLIGIPELNMEVRNQSRQAVIAYTIAAECRDRFDQPAVEIKRDNIYRGISQTTVQPGAIHRGEWALNLHRNATKLKVWISRVKLADGSEWSQTDADAAANGNVVDVQMK